MHLQRELQIDRVISNPEFLSEDTAEKDSKNPPFVLLGGLEGRYLENIKGVYRGRIKTAPIILTDNTTAEFTKLALNSYFATKVIFANQIYDYAQSLGVNYEQVKSTLEMHPYGPKNHFKIWFKGKRGVNGRCLPKDTTAMANYGNLELLKKVLELNENYIRIKE
jgi:UDPglucose 6-dehydrogenase